MDQPDRNPGQSSWRIRRRFMFAVSAFCMWTVAYVLWRDLSSGPADTAVTMSFLTLLGIVGSYVFGATWEDIRMTQMRGSSAVASRASKPAPSPGAQTKIEDQP